MHPYKSAFILSLLCSIFLTVSLFAQVPQPPQHTNDQSVTKTTTPITPKLATSSTEALAHSNSAIVSYSIDDEQHGTPYGGACYDITIALNSQIFPKKEELIALAKKVSEERTKSEDLKKSIVRFWIPEKSTNAYLAGYSQGDEGEPSPSLSISEAYADKFLDASSTQQTNSSIPSESPLEKSNQHSVKTTISSYSVLERRFRSNGSHTFEVAIVPRSRMTPAKSELETIAQKIIDDEQITPVNTYIEFYLPGQYTGAGTDQPYADAFFNPNPVVEINNLN